MMILLRHIQDFAFFRWVSESHSIFAYPGILFLHILGMAIIVAVSAAACLRALGYFTQVPFSSINKFFPLMWTAFWMNVVTGTTIAGADATEKLRNPDFYVKISCVILAALITRTLSARLFRNGSGDTAPVAAGNKVLAGLALFLWVAVVTAGRLLAYVGNPDS